MFQFGPKIFDKINDKINPEFPDDDQPCDVFDFWSGANFRLRAHLVNKQRSYDKSVFDTPSELYDGDETKLRQVYDSLHKLQDFVAPSEFKSPADLQARFNQTTGVKAGMPQDKMYDDDIPAPPTRREPEEMQPQKSEALDDDELDQYAALLGA